MSATWTQRQDDNAAFEEAMDVADIAVREWESRVNRIARQITLAASASREATRDRHTQLALAMCSGLVAVMQRPEISRWRQQHSEGRGKRHSQQHVLEVKLAFARELLQDRGVELDAELAKRRLGS